MTFGLAPALLLAAVLGFQAPAPVGQPPAASQAVSESDRRIWPEFAALLKDGRMDEQHVRATYVTNATLLGFLASFRSSASWPEWERQPEVYRVGSLVHCVAKLSERGVAGTYSFTFLTENGRWFLAHYETIVLRLDRIGALPVSEFPDLGEGKKAWMREENYWSQMVTMFRRMRLAAGDEAAFAMFRDGAGYAVSAATWVPFVAPSRAFVLYACWEQSRLHGNAVTLERLDDNAAVIVLDSTYFALYRQTGHLRNQISEEDYRRIFETIWRDRTAAAGWNAEFAYEKTKVTMRLTARP